MPYRSPSPHPPDNLPRAGAWVTWVLASAAAGVAVSLWVLFNGV